MRGLTAILLLASAAPALADEPVKPAAVQDYCAMISDKAGDARLAWQMDNLKKLEGEIVSKLSELSSKQAELQEWVGRREQMLKAANQSLVDIYAKMDPEAAAAQLVQIDSTTATSILRQLQPRGASAILNIMDPGKAAALARLIAAAAKDAAPARGGS